MKKLLLLFLLAFLAVPIANAEESVVTLTTTLDEGASIKLYTWADSMDDAFTIDWGDGVEKIYNKVKPSWTYGSEITGKLVAQARPSPSRATSLILRLERCRFLPPLSPTRS